MVNRISYRLSDGKEGEISDPAVLRYFWFRIMERYRMECTLAVEQEFEAEEVEQTKQTVKGN